VNATDHASPRASWVGAISATRGIVVAVVRWAMLRNADRPLRELAGPDGFMGDAPRPGPRFVKRPVLSDQGRGGSAPKTAQGTPSPQLTVRSA
jgi:hypothetical protein